MKKLAFAVAFHEKTDRRLQDAQSSLTESNGDTKEHTHRFMCVSIEIGKVLSRISYRPHCRPIQENAIPTFQFLYHYSLCTAPHTPR